MKRSFTEPFSYFSGLLASSPFGLSSGLLTCSRLAKNSSREGVGTIIPLRVFSFGLLGSAGCSCFSSVMVLRLARD